MGIKTTKQHLNYWKNRKIDWNQAYLSTWNHPHRELVTWVLRTIPFYSLWEVGCGPGPNLVKITQTIPNKQLGGSDINEDAISLAQKTFNGGMFHVKPTHDLMMSDSSVDVVLSDANLIYYGPTMIKKALREMIRVGRRNLVLCELHEKSIWKRWLYRFKRGYNVYDYKKLLESLGCYDIQLFKIPKDFWEGTPWEEFGYIIKCRIPKK